MIKLNKLEIVKFSQKLLRENHLRSIYGGKLVDTCLEDYPECKDILHQNGTTTWTDQCGKDGSKCDTGC